ncbi:MAG: hypothetical protein Q7U76_01810 [Nitrospirota bacterium]|nr:hypothetical protein [Nitrospirota bacterium]
MNLKRTVTVGVVAVGLMCSAGYAQATESSQTAPGSPFAGAFGGVIDLSVPGGVRNMNNTGGTKAEAAKAQPAVAKDSAATGASATTAPSASGAAGAAGAAAK